LAIITGNKTYAWAIRMGRFFLPVKLKVFASDEEKEALSWVME
jgi:hypothetical protein